MTQQNSQSRIAQGVPKTEWVRSLFPVTINRLARRSLQVLAVAVSLEALMLAGVADERLPTGSYVRASGIPRPGFAMEIIPKAAAFKAQSDAAVDTEVAQPHAEARRVIVPDATQIIERGRANNTGISLQDRAERLRAGLRGTGSGETDDVGEMAMPLIRRTAQRIGAIPPVPQESTRNISVVRNLTGASDASRDEAVASGRTQLPRLPYSIAADSSQSKADASQSRAAYPASEAAVPAATVQEKPAPMITASYPEDGEMVVYDVPEWKPHSPGHSFTGELPSRSSMEGGMAATPAVSGPGAQAIARYSDSASAGSGTAMPSMAFYPPEGGLPESQDMNRSPSMIAALPDYQSLPSLPSAGYSQAPMLPQPTVTSIPQLPSAGMSGAIVTVPTPQTEGQPGVVFQAPGTSGQQVVPYILQAPIGQPAPMILAAPGTMPGYQMPLPAAPQYVMPPAMMPQYVPAQPQQYFAPGMDPTFQPSYAGGMPIYDQQGQGYTPQGYGYAMAPPTAHPNGGTSLGGLPLQPPAAPTWLPRNSSRSGGLYGGRYGGNGNITKVPSSRYGSSLAASGAYRGAASTKYSSPAVPGQIRAEGPGSGRYSP